MPTAKQFEVFVDAGDVWIAQNKEGGKKQDVIRINPCQVPLLAQWLSEAADVLAKNSDTTAG